MERSIIKTRQQWALTHPRRTIESCGANGVRADLHFGGRRLATVLMVPMFELPLSWHAQIGIVWPNGQCVPVEQWQSGDASGAVTIAKRMLEGVGQPITDRILFDELSVRVTRRVTADEAITAANAAGLLSTVDVLVGEVGVYNFANRRSQCGDGAFQPVHIEKVYERRDS